MILKDMPLCRSSGKRRLRLLKTLPTKSTPVYALKVCTLSTLHKFYYVSVL
jgi:hypothetical protein